MDRQPYPSDVSDQEWAWVAPYLTLMREDAPQRDHRLREVFNGSRYIVRTGMQWRMMCIDRGHGLHMFGDMGNRYPSDIMLRKAQKCNLSCHEVDMEMVRILGGTQLDALTRER